MPQQETLTGPSAAGAGSQAGMQVTGPPRAPVLRHAQARVPLVPFRLEEAVRSDKHAPAACTALAVTAVPAVLAGNTTLALRGDGDPPGRSRGNARFPRCASVGGHPTPASRSLHDALAA